MLLFTALLTLSQAASSKPPGVPDFGCILWKCGGKAAGCKTNSACSKTIDCNEACTPGDMACPSRCIIEFGTDQFDDLSICVQKNNCITPFPKDIVYQVPVQTSVATLSDFVGDWYSIAGLDHGTDCYDNQQIKFYSTGPNTFARVATIAFPERPDRVIASVVTQDGSTITNQYTLGGGGKDTVYILGSTPALAVAMYIGENFVAKYRGAFVLRKTPGPMTDDEKVIVGEMLDASNAGFTVDDLCLLK